MPVGSSAGLGAVGAGAGVITGVLSDLTLWAGAVSVPADGLPSGRAGGLFASPCASSGERCASVIDVQSTDFGRSATPRSATRASAGGDSSDTNAPATTTACTTTACRKSMLSSLLTPKLAPNPRVGYGSNASRCGALGSRSSPAKNLAYQ